jgi:hypothetical protein
VVWAGASTVANSTKNVKRIMRITVSIMTQPIRGFKGALLSFQIESDRTRLRTLLHMLACSDRFLTIGHVARTL